MKNTLTLFLAVTTGTLGVICAVQSSKSTGQQTQLASLQDELDERAQRIEALQAAKKRSDQQRHELMVQADDLAAQFNARQLAETNTTALVSNNSAPFAEGEKPDQEKGGLAKMLSAIMQDPDTKQLIRNTQRMMMDQLYAPLVKKMGLTPDEAVQFKNLLADNTMKASEKAFSMFGGAASTNRTEMLNTLGPEQKIFDEQVKALLGDERYALYKDYQETAGERMQLNAFKMQAGSDYTLNDEQTEALVSLMREENKNLAATTGLPLGDAHKDPAKLQALLSEDKAAELLQAQETTSQRVYDRARSILSPDQLETFCKFQTNQLQMMQMGMSMARKLFAPDKSENEGLH